MHELALVDPTESLPNAIWIPAAAEPVVYRGDPLEMVRAMADEMGDLSPRDAIDMLLDALASNHSIRIDLQEASDLPDEGYAHLFVFALLDTGIAHPLPQA